MTAISRSTGGSRVMQIYVDGGFQSAFQGHPRGYAHGAAILGKDVALMSSILKKTAPDAYPTRLFDAAQAGLAVAIESGQSREAGQPGAQPK